MSYCGTLTTPPSVLRNVEWSNVEDASGPILRRAVSGAILRDDRIEIAFDADKGDYVLGISSSF